MVGRKMPRQRGVAGGVRVDGGHAAADLARGVERDLAVAQLRLPDRMALRHPGTPSRTSRTPRSSPRMRGTAPGTMRAGRPHPLDLVAIALDRRLPVRLTLSFGSARLTQIGPRASPTRTMSDETPPVSGVMAGRSPALQQPHARERAEEEVVAHSFLRVSRAWPMPYRWRIRYAWEMRCELYHSHEGHSRPRPGHHQFARDRIRQAGQCARPRAAGTHPDLSAVRLGGAGSGRDLVDPARDCACGAAHRPGSSAEGHRRDRYHQPARNHSDVGTRDRPADLQRHRLAGPAHRWLVRATARRRAWKRCSPDAPGCCSTRISPEPSCAGSSTTSKARVRAPRRAILPSARWTAWLIWKLTGGRVHVTDVSNASRTMMFNIHTRDWDDKLLGLLRVPRCSCCRKSWLRARSAPSRCRALRSRHCRSRGIAGDQQAALFGQQCTATGHGEEHLRHRLLHADAHRHEAGGVAQPIADHRGLENRREPSNMRWRAACSSPVRRCSGCATGWASSALLAEVEALARSVPDNGGVYLVPAFAGLGRAALGSVCAR